MPSGAVGSRERRLLATCSALVLLAGRAACTRIVVGGQHGWELGRKYKAITARPGDVLEFKYDAARHNVRRQQAGECGLTVHGASNSTGAPAPAETEASPKLVEIEEAWVGQEWLFTSTLGEDCRKGLRVLVDVQAQGVQAPIAIAEASGSQVDEVLLRQLSGARHTGGCEAPVLLNAERAEYSVTCVSPSVAMRPGQVVNTNLLFPNPFPEGRAVALVEQTAQLVRAVGLQPAPASEVYLHHFVTVDTLIVPPPTGQGLISRRSFPAPYELIVGADRLTPPSRRYVNLHLINTVGALDRLGCVECRCPEEYAGLEPVRTSATRGGVLCCRDCPTAAAGGPEVDYALRYTTAYRHLDEASSAREVQLARIDAALGIGERIEYFVPRDPSGAEQVVNYDFRLNDLMGGAALGGPVQALRCDGHQHEGGTCMELYQRNTNTLVCSSCPVMAEVSGLAGDPSAGPLVHYVGEMTSTELAPPLGLDPNEPLRLVAKYNATESHTGVMSILFLYFSAGEERSGLALAGPPADPDADVGSYEAFTEAYPSLLAHDSPGCQRQMWQFWANCPAGGSAAEREENAVVCCSVLGALTASQCTCTALGFAEPDLVDYMAHWSASCSRTPMWVTYRAACHGSGDPSWRWGNLFSFVGLDAAMDAVYASYIYFYNMFLSMWVWSLGLVPIVWLNHWALRYVGGKSYRRLPAAERAIAVSHATYCSVFFLQCIPYTYLMGDYLFGPDFSAAVNSDSYIFLSGMVIAHGLLYFAEGGLRGFIKPNSMLMAHHCLFFTLPIVTFASRSVLTFKVVLVIDLFATYEFLLYAALVMRRLQAPVAATRRVLVAGVWIYGVTRLVQLAILVTLFGGSMGRMAGQPLFWVLFVITTVLLVIQGYTFQIYYGIYRRLATSKEGTYSAVGDSSSSSDDDSQPSPDKGKALALTPVKHPSLEL